MAVGCSLWSFGIFFPIWYVWTTKNLATLPDINYTKRQFFVDWLLTFQAAKQQLLATQSVRIQSLYFFALKTIRTKK
jgi:hypothetical protein